jgi:hypothetical protein
MYRLVLALCALLLPIEGAEEFIEISRIRRVSGNCASLAPAATAPQQDMSGAKMTVIAGVVVGGAGAAVYLVSKTSNDQGTISR